MLLQALAHKCANAFASPNTMLQECPHNCNCLSFAQSGPYSQSIIQQITHVINMIFLQCFENMAPGLPCYPCSAIQLHAEVQELSVCKQFYGFCANMLSYACWFNYVLKVSQWSLNGGD
jgi:hypothetical protein